jgi:hypothetical protein
MVMSPTCKNCSVNEMNVCRTVDFCFNWREDTEYRGNMLLKYLWILIKCLIKVDQITSACFEVTTH